MLDPLPCFTRGLEFVGRYAFVGRSQVRETAVFSGIPITDRLPAAERSCGVWVVDVETGQTDYSDTDFSEQFKKTNKVC